MISISAGSVTRIILYCRKRHIVCTPPFRLTSQYARHNGGVPEIYAMDHDHADIGNLLGGIAARIAEEQANQNGTEHMNAQLQVGKSLEVVLKIFK